jgi:hypothetical protein
MPPPHTPELALLREMVDLVYKVTRVKDWETAERLSWQTTVQPGAGLYVMSSFLVLEDGTAVPPSIDRPIPAAMRCDLTA